MNFFLRFFQHSLDKCPYCDFILKKFPERKTKCTNCQNTIFVKISPLKNNKIIVTEKEAKEIDKEWDEINFKTKRLEDLSKYNITNQDFEKEKKTLEKRFWTNPSNNDIIWGLFNKVLQIVPQEEAKIVYYEMAIFLASEWKQCSHLLEQSSKIELLNYKKHWINKVEIIWSDNSCESCKKIQGTIISIEEALQKSLIPCKQCSNKIFSDGINFCRCSYIGKIDD